MSRRDGLMARVRRRRKASSRIRLTPTSAEDIPYETADLFLSTLWDELILRQPADACPAAKRAVLAGASPGDVETAMRAAAYEAVFGMLWRLNFRGDEDADDGTPGWMLMEAIDADSDEPVLTGREIGGLHESILSLDPRGIEGADLFE